MVETDPVSGYAIVGYEFVDGRYQDIIVMVGGAQMALEDFKNTLPGNMRVDTIPFPVFDDCCDLQQTRLA